MGSISQESPLSYRLILSTYLSLIAQTKQKKSFLFILLLVLAGEGIFVMPFILQRVFRSTFLDVFQLTNEELGYCFSTYGIVALLSYLFGGSLADRFKPQNLIALSLWMTAAVGIWMASFPSYSAMIVIYGLFGFSTIFLFWSALIKSTRVWGGQMDQGKGFGFLDGGRGLVGAGFGALGVIIFSSLANEEVANIPLEEKQAIFRSVILYSSLFVALIGTAVFFVLRVDKEINPKEKNPISYYIECIKLPAVWLLMAIIFCAYVGYKSTDYFSQIAKEVMGYNEIQAGQIGTWMLVLRAVTAVVVGFLADKFNDFKLLIIFFSVLTIGAGMIGLGLLSLESHILFLLIIITTGIGVYAIRVLYYTTMQKGKIPLIYTGTAVGIISIVGYAPDIFFGPVTGRLLDKNG